ncbi:exodeoxyribonuclease III [Thermodesulfobacteriota bacterium]
MKLATFNTNSIRARMPILLDWLEREKPDVLFLQETKVQDKDFPTLQLEGTGYQIIFRGQKSYNGIAVLSKQPLKDVHMNLYEEGDRDARFISAKLADLTLINVYVPQGFAPGSEKFDYKLRWLRDLLSLLEREYDPDEPLIIAGDFNVALEAIDLFDPQGHDGDVGYHPDERAIFRKYFDWGLFDVFRKHQPDGGHYTFWDYRVPNAVKRKIGWRIDYILTTKTLADTCQRVWIDKEARALPKPSDHTFLVAEFQLDV